MVKSRTKSLAAASVTEMSQEATSSRSSGTRVGMVVGAFAAFGCVSWMIIVVFCMLRESKKVPGEICARGVSFLFRRSLGAGGGLQGIQDKQLDMYDF